MTLIETITIKNKKNRTMKKLFFLLLSVTLPFLLSAQCEPGEIEVVLSLDTDAWGYEAYWEIVPTGNACGLGVIAFGGNLDQVGCDGGGEQDATGGNGYPSNTTVLSDPICLQLGVTYDIHYIDDYTDGGLNFEVLQEGVLTYIFDGPGENVFTFTAGETGIEPGDLPCFAFEIEADGPALEYDNSNATASPGEPAPANGGCGTIGLWCENGLSNTIWATFEPEAGQTYTFTTCVVGTAFDTQLALYSSNSCDDFDQFTLISSNDDGGCGIADGFASTMSASCMDPDLTYFLQIDGYNGATGVGALQITSTDQDVQLTANINNVSCPLDKQEPGDGDITLQLANYGSNYTSEWTGPNGFTSIEQWLTDVDPGIYEVTVTDACGTSYQDSFEITQPDPINVFYTVVPPACPLSADGSISAVVSGGNGPYELIWSGPELFTQDGQQLTELNEGQYAVLLTDDNNCEYTNNVNLTSVNELGLNLGMDTTICNTQDLVLSGPLGYNYEWQDGSNNQFFILEGDEIGEGQFSVILNIENELGCNAFDALVVTVEACVGVEEEQELAFEIYPNPANQLINLNTDVKGYQCVIYDALGQLVWNEQITGNQKQIDSSAFANGLYTIQLSDGKQSIAKQLIIQH